MARQLLEVVVTGTNIGPLMLMGRSNYSPHARTFWVYPSDAWPIAPAFCDRRLSVIGAINRHHHALTWGSPRDIEDSCKAVEDAVNGPALVRIRKGRLSPLTIQLLDVPGNSQPATARLHLWTNEVEYNGQVLLDNSLWNTTWRALSHRDPSYTYLFLTTETNPVQYRETHKLNRYAKSEHEGWARQFTYETTIDTTVTMTVEQKESGRELVNETQVKFERRYLEETYQRSRWNTSEEDLY